LSSGDLVRRAALDRASSSSVEELLAVAETRQVSKALAARRGRCAGGAVQRAGWRVLGGDEGSDERDTSKDTEDGNHIVRKDSWFSCS